MKQQSPIALRAIVIAMTVFASSAYAQFDGPYIGAGLGLYKATEEANEPSINSRFVVGDNKHRLGLNLNGGYGRTFGNFHVAGELSYTSEMGRVTATLLGQDLTDKLRDAIAISVLPGFKLAANTLGFVRIGAARAKFEVTGGASEKHNGVLWGVGVKQAFSRNVAGVFEYQSLDLKKKNDIEPGATGVLFGVQYTF